MKCVVVELVKSNTFRWFSHVKKIKNEVCESNVSGIKESSRIG